MNYRVYVDKIAGHTRLISSFERLIMSTLRTLLKISKFVQSNPEEYLHFVAALFSNLDETNIYTHKTCV